MAFVFVFWLLFCIYLDYFHISESFPQYMNAGHLEDKYTEGTPASLDRQ